MLRQDPDPDLSRRPTTSKGKTHGGMTTLDSHMGSDSQHRLSDQISANTIHARRAVCNVDLGLLSRPTTAAQPWRRELVLMPLKRPRNAPSLRDRAWR